MPGLTPIDTTVNLFDYDTGIRNGDTIDGRVIGNASKRGTDTLQTGIMSSALDYYKVWLDNPNGINYGRMLTFGDGMRYLGYWNQGLVAGNGQFAKEHPGMQNMVQPELVDGSPVLSESVNPDTYPAWLLTGGYNEDPSLYNIAAYALAGGKNISNGVQYLVLEPGDISNVPANTSTGGGQIIDQSLRSLDYLFDPDVSSSGRVATHTDVGGLFQMDDEGYYYYNMRENYAWYDPSTNDFVLYDQPAGTRTDGTDSIGNFFPFNSPADAFSIGEDGSLVNAMSSDNDTSTNSAPVNHHLGLTMQTEFRQPTNGMVGDNPMSFQFVGDDDLWVFIDDVLVMDLGGIHSELFGTIDFSTGEVKLGTAFDSNGQILEENVCPEYNTTIKQMFQVAGKDTSTGFTGDTFASNTSHTLKMFYMERGNYDSSLAVKFNLQPLLFQQIKKVNQDAEPIEGATFDVYPVTSVQPSVTSTEEATLENVTYDPSQVLTSVTTGEDGAARFMDGADPYNFADRVDDSTDETKLTSRLYVLHETSAPPGYRMMPTDILMRYDQETATFVVNNRYDTGSYASFNSYVTQTSPESLTFGSFDGSTGTIQATDTHVPKNLQENGLIVAIPTLKQGTDATRWDPVYGSNEDTLHTISYSVSDVNAMRQAMLDAALYQAYMHAESEKTVPGWYLSWGSEERLTSYQTIPDASGSGTRVECTLADLPGNPSRYRLNNDDGDMQMVYGVFTSDMFDAGTTAEQKYAQLADLVRSKLGDVEDPTSDQLRAAVELARSDIMAMSTPEATGDFGSRGFSAIEANPQQFIRTFRTVINVPNEQRELRVWKLDQNGDRVDGAVFGLFDSLENAQNATSATVGDDYSVTINGQSGQIKTIAAGVTGKISDEQARYRGDDLGGMLIFAPYLDQGPGAAHTEWIDDSGDLTGKVLYLKEVEPPIGYESNNSIITVVIGRYGIYADAGTANDGVDVYAGVGKLSSTMKKYAASPDFNLTLRYITAIAQTQPSSCVPSGSTSVDFDDFNSGWQTSDKSMNLEYGVNALVDYGSPEAFTQEQIDNGIGYVDEEGRQRPLFRASTGYIRTDVEQDTEAMIAAQSAAGNYALGDNLQGRLLTSLFMIRNTVAITDLRHPEPVLRKVDQNGERVAGAKFQLFAIDLPEGTSDESLANITLSEVSDQITDSSQPVASVTTGADETDGNGIFIDQDGQSMDFAKRARELGMSGGRLYVLRETQAPAGFRKLSSDVLIRYDADPGQLVVNNRYDTGATACFRSEVTVDSSIHFAAYSDGTVSTVLPDGANIGFMSADEQQKGLVMPVPVIKSGDRWLPLYGDITQGFEVCDGPDQRSLIRAALMQALLYANGSGDPWHLVWDQSLSALSGTLDDLPGTPDRYLLKNSDGDMQMVYAYLSPDALKAAGVANPSATDIAYRQLGAAVRLKGADAVLDAVMATQNGFGDENHWAVYAHDFNRNFQSIIYVPNEQRELRVWKLDEDDRRVNNVVFALFDSEDDARRASSAHVSNGVVSALYDANGDAIAPDAYAAGVTGLPDTGNSDDNQPGTLVFAPYVSNAAGSCHTDWTDAEGNDITGKVLYLKEIQASAGYEVNETLIPVVVGKYGIYADACAEDDGVKVLSGVGRLSAPMRQFASSPYVNLTLRYITATAEQQPSLSFDDEGELDDARYDDATGMLSFDRWDADWTKAMCPSDGGGSDSSQAASADDDPYKTMDLEYGAPGALVSYGMMRAFTEDELACGIGYIDAYGAQRPLFVTDTGFIRSAVSQNTALMDEMRSAGSQYEGVRADDLSGLSLNQLFMLRNTVCVTDKGSPITPPGPDDYTPVKPYYPADGSNLVGIPQTGDDTWLKMRLLLLAAVLSGAGAYLLRRNAGHAGVGRASVEHARTASHGAHRRT